MIWPGWRLPFCQSSPGPHVSRWRFLISYGKLSETCPRSRQNCWSIDIPTVVHAAFLFNIQIRMSSSGYVNVFQCNREWFFSRWVKFDSEFNEMAVFEISLEVVEENLLILHESQYYSLLEFVDAVQRWMILSSWSPLSRGFDSSICDWKNKFSWFGKYHLFRIESLRADFRCVHRFQLLKVCDQYVTNPNSHRVQSVSEEQSR